METSQKTTVEKFARVCSVTTEGMNEGWCFESGAFYAKSQEHADGIARLKYGYLDFEHLYDEDDDTYFTDWFDLDGNGVSTVTVDGMRFFAPGEEPNVEAAKDLKFDLLQRKLIVVVERMVDGEPVDTIALRCKPLQPNVRGQVFDRILAKYDDEAVFLQTAEHRTYGEVIEVCAPYEPKPIDVWRFTMVTV